MMGDLEIELFKEFFAVALRKGDVISKDIGQTDSPCYLCNHKINYQAMHANLPGDEKTFVALHYSCFKEAMLGEWDRNI